MANEIRTLLNSVANVNSDWKQDWKEDVRVDWKVDWAVDTGQPVNTVLPVISDTTPTVEDVLTVTTGTWTGTATIVYTYQWYRGTTEIAGATANTYTVVEADIDATLKVRVRAENGKGTAFVDTAATTAVVNVG